MEKENEISGIKLAEILGVTDRYVRKLASENVLQKSGTRGRYLLKESIQGYINFLKEGSSVDIALKDVKIKKETEKLDKDIELKTIRIAELRNDLHSAEIVEKVMTTMLLNLKGKLLSVPNKIAPLVVGCDNLGDIQSIILESIEDTLLEVSKYSKELFKNKEVFIEEDDLEDGKEKFKVKGGRKSTKIKKNN